MTNTYYKIVKEAFEQILTSEGNNCLPTVFQDAEMITFEKEIDEMADKIMALLKSLPEESSKLLDDYLVSINTKVDSDNIAYYMRGFADSLMLITQMGLTTNENVKKMIGYMFKTVFHN